MKARTEAELDALEQSLIDRVRTLWPRAILCMGRQISSLGTMHTLELRTSLYQVPLVKEHGPRPVLLHRLERELDLADRRASPIFERNA